jgi:hypothetical protein
MYLHLIQFSVTTKVIGYSVDRVSNKEPLFCQRRLRVPKKVAAYAATQTIGLSF